MTERLLLDLFETAGCEQHLLILRPSCFALPQEEPFLHFKGPGSTPVTTAMCAIVASPPTQARCTSNFVDPSKSTIDEAPMDIVVNRLVAHNAFGSYGCLHAVSGESGRRSFSDMYSAMAKLRRSWWWHPTSSWCDDDSEPSKICVLSRFYKILDCSYDFRQEKTTKVWELTTPCSRENWPLWTQQDPTDMSDFVIRGRTCKDMLSVRMVRKHGSWGRLMANTIGPKA